MYGHSAIQWQDYGQIYRLSYYILCRVFQNKLSLVMTMRKQWPMYATFDEDLTLWKENWNEIFHPEKKQRIIMHDNTNVCLVKPSNPALQRALYSQYYCRCVGKGGVALQLCGWTTTLELCTGRMEDSAYIKSVKIFEQQKTFAEKDPSSPNPFINILDRGYRVVLHAHQLGGQLCIQPQFAQSDGMFNTEDVLYSAAVATVHSGNERSVHQVKSSWLIK